MTDDDEDYDFSSPDWQVVLQYGIDGAQKKGDHERAQRLYRRQQGVEDDAGPAATGTAPERLRRAAIESLEVAIGKAQAQGDHEEANHLYLRQQAAYAEEESE